MDLLQLTEQGYASGKELVEAGIKKKFELGRNEYGLQERVIIDNNNNQWDYMPEDYIYELRTGEAETVYLNLV